MGDRGGGDRLADCLAHGGVEESVAVAVMGDEAQFDKNGPAVELQDGQIRAEFDAAVAKAGDFDECVLERPGEGFVVVAAVKHLKAAGGVVIGII